MPLVAGSFPTVGLTWQHGDNNFDGVVNIDDALNLVVFFGGNLNPALPDNSAALPAAAGEAEMLEVTPTAADSVARQRAALPETDAVPISPSTQLHNAVRGNSRVRNQPTVSHAAPAPAEETIARVRSRYTDRDDFGLRSRLSGGQRATQTDLWDDALPEETDVAWELAVDGALATVRRW